MFESLDASSLTLAVPAVLSLLASGATTGLVVDSGEGCTSVVPVYEGLALRSPAAVQRLERAGVDVTQALRAQLRRASFLPRGEARAGVGAQEESRSHYGAALGPSSVHSSAELEVVRELKEAACFVAARGRPASAASAPQATAGAFRLPDGQAVQLSEAERSSPAEVLFGGEGSAEQPGVHHAVALSLRACDVALRERLLGSILLAGGTTTLPGYGARLAGELQLLAPEGVRVRIAAPAGRASSAWVGGSILASLSSFHSEAVTKARWEESGASAFD